VLPAQVIIREVSLRDGLQIVRRAIPTATKLEWIRDAHAAGLRQFEVGSFVPPRLMPQLADTAEVLAYARTLPGVVASVLVPNVKGAERAIAEEADSMLLPLSASHAHSLANLRKTPDEVVTEIGRIRAARDAANSPTRLEVGISTAFGCTIQGQVDEREVVRLVQAVLDAGVDSVGLADTVGYADPAMVSRLLEKTLRVAGGRLTTAHFHDTRGLGMANCYAALQMGITRLDACIGGIGGCPHAPGASGNVSTEDLVYMLSSMRVSTGINFHALIALRVKVAAWLAGETLHGSLWRAGLPKTMEHQEITA
jgi:hydroxymethylglutaryl-CoA lyase